ncbi:MAG: phosphoenolpyruvate--protein phosphotransferase [Spirochaetes bacterium]|nr:phosphoenolpyruvate--protein phosphotransferase [Spirochaetota bacterium]
MKKNNNIINKEKEITRGIVVSHGVSMGKALVLTSDIPYVPKYSIMRSQIAHELDRLEEAIQKTKQDIRTIKKKAESEIISANLNYFDAHLLMLDDPVLQTQIKTDIHNSLLNIEAIVDNALNAIAKKMSSMDNEYFKERVADVRDIQKRVLFHLLGKKQIDIQSLAEDVIIVSHDLTVSQTANMDRRHVKGFITEVGGKTSHTAIFARALELPAIVGISDIRSEFKDGDYIIIDANHGKIIANPTVKNIKLYETAKHVYERFIKKLSFLNQLPAESTDHHKINLNANIEILDEIDSTKTHGAEGIGLFRSEFIFLESIDLPSEERQFEVYKEVLTRMNNMPVVIRTIDLGGDKLTKEHEAYQESNPFLGWRSIRYCLSKPEIFRTQLRALLRASVYGKLEIMFPMISGVDELLMVKEFVEMVKNDLRKEKIEFNNDIKMGIMIEVPSAALSADALAPHVDFFSIGTNDLIQYTLAVDRGNEKVSYLYNSLHPAVLRLIKMTISAGESHNIPVEMCGEMAGNPINSVLLIGLGLKELSMSSVFIPEVKKVIRSSSYIEAKKLADEILALGNVDKIEKHLMTFMRTHFPYLIDKIMS